MTEAKDWANRVYANYLNDPDLQEKCQNSVEFYRCMMYAGLSNAEEIDGTDLYSAIVDEIEEMVVNNNSPVDLNT